MERLLKERKARRSGAPTPASTPGQCRAPHAVPASGSNQRSPRFTFLLHRSLLLRGLLFWKGQRKEAVRSPGAPGWGGGGAETRVRVSAGTGTPLDLSGRCARRAFSIGWAETALGKAQEAREDGGQGGGPGGGREWPPASLHSPSQEITWGPHPQGQRTPHSPSGCSLRAGVQEKEWGES